MQFENWFANMAGAVMVCNPKSLDILFMNTEAKSCLCADVAAPCRSLRDMLRFCEKNDAATVMETLSAGGVLQGYPTLIFAGNPESETAVKLNAHIAGGDGTDYLLISFVPEPKVPHFPHVRKEAENTLQIMRRVLDNLDAFIYVSDMETYEILFMNRALKRELGFKGDVSGKICWQTLQRGQKGPCEFCPNPKLFDEKGEPVGSVRGETQNTISKKWFTTMDCAIKWMDGKYVHLESAVEITERKQNEMILERSASLDPLTGVYNRGWGYKLADRVMYQMREENQLFSVVFIDVDGLKRVNDLYGHSEGDSVLLHVVEQVRGSTRKNDIIFRWGGDEFVLVLAACPLERAQFLMDEVARNLKNLNRKLKKPFVIDISYGIAEIPYTFENDIASVIDLADQKMYKKKQEKKKKETSPDFPLPVGRQI